MTTDCLSSSLTEFCPFCESHYKIMYMDKVDKFIGKEIDSLLRRYRDSFVYYCKKCDLCIVADSHKYFINQIIFKNNNNYISVESCIVWYSNFHIFVNTFNEIDFFIYDEFPRDKLNIKDFVNYIRKYVDNQIFI